MALFSLNLAFLGLAGCSTSQSQTADQAESRRDFVQAYLLHSKACERCMASHPGQGHGERCGPPYEMGEFVYRFVHNNNGALLDILQSPRIPKKNKEGILQYLNEAIEKEYPGSP